MDERLRLGGALRPATLRTKAVVGPLGRLPLDLELYFFPVVALLMLKIVLSPYWHIDALACDLDLEALTILKGVGKPAELFNELR